MNKNKRFIVPKISLNYDKITKVKDNYVYSVDDIVKLLRFDFQDELNHLELTWVVLLKTDKEDPRRKVVIGFSELKFSDLVLNKLHFKESIKLSLLSDANTIVFIYNRPHKNLKFSISEERDFDRINQMMNMFDIYLWNVIKLSKKTYLSIK